MINYKNRSKINPKIIFNNLAKDVKNALIIGENNIDLIEVLKAKKISFEELEKNNEVNILEYLSLKIDKKIDLIILNLELSNLNRLNFLINTLVDKSKYCVIRFRNHNYGSIKITKKKIINKIIKNNKIDVINKFYSKNNFFCSNIVFKPFSYCTIYFIKRNIITLNYEISIIEKIKKLLFSKKEFVKLSINKK